MRILAAQHHSVEECLQSPRANKTDAFLAVIGAITHLKCKTVCVFFLCHYARMKIPAEKRLLRSVLMKSLKNLSVSKSMPFAFFFDF